MWLSIRQTYECITPAVYCRLTSINLFYVGCTDSGICISNGPIPAYFDDIRISQVHTVGDIKNLTFRSVKTPYYEFRSMRTTIVTYAYCVRSERSLCVAGL